MDRLTKKDFKFDMLNIINGRNKYCEIDDIMKALQSYEDTGLTPEEIEQLKSENAESMKLLTIAATEIQSEKHCHTCINFIEEQGMGMIRCSRPECDLHNNCWQWQYQDRYDKLMKESEVSK